MRRTRSAVALLAGLLLGGCASTAGDRPPDAAAPPCPASKAAGVVVPAAPTAGTVGRLVPERPPTQALLCRYQGDGDASLTGEVGLSAGLERLPQDLLLPAAASPLACDADRAVAPEHLLRLTYPDGVVWVASTCAATSNGPFSSGYDRSDVLSASFTAGAWTVPPQPDADQRCVPERTGRAGQEFALLPTGSTSLVLCRIAGDGTTRRTATQAQRMQVQAALDTPVATRQPTRCAQSPEQYELVARYPVGPPVQVAYLPGCALDVGNGSLQAALEPDGERAVRNVVGQAFGRR